jgi:N-acetylmuramoyl-L-alanine amidase
MIKKFTCFLVLFAFCYNASIEAAVTKPRHRNYHQAIRSSCSEKTLSPLLPYKPVIILDPGHGGNDEGAKVGQFIEKKITLKLAQITKQALEFRGYKVRMTRSKDEYVSLADRVEMASLVKAKLFLSLHCNSSPVNKDVHGVEIFYHESKDAVRLKSSKRLASQALHCFLQQTGAHSRGVKKGNFYVIRETSMPSILIEIGFLTHSDERLRLNDHVYLEKIAHGIATSVDRFFNY